MKVSVVSKSDKFAMPRKKEGHDRDFCYDVTAISAEEIAPNVWKYRLGFAAQIRKEPIVLHDVDGKEYRFCPDAFIWDIDFRPRSSVWKTGMILSNCEGTIDEIYTGEISAVFYHVLPNMPRYDVGDRIGQIKIGFTIPMEFEEVEFLEETVRGEGAYGSTGR